MEDWREKVGWLQPTHSGHYVTNPKNKANIRDKSSNFDHHPKKWTWSKHLNAPQTSNLSIPTSSSHRDPTSTSARAWKDSRCSTTLRPLGPKVTLTALATALMPPWSLGRCDGLWLTKQFHCHLFSPTKWWILKLFKHPTKKWRKNKTHQERKKGDLFRNLSMFNKGFTFCNPWKNTTNWYSPRHIRTNWCSLRHLPNKIWSRYFCCPASLKEIFLAAWQLGGCSRFVTVGWAWDQEREENELEWG